MKPENFTTLSKLELEAMAKALPHMSLQEKMELFEDLELRESRAKLQAAKHNMLGFAQSVYPGFKIGPHHKKLAKIFTDVVEGRKKRVIINIAPRMGKSEFSSYLFPAYFLGKYPNKKIIMGTHTAGLSEDFGRRVRNLIDSEEYREVFPQTLVADDQKAAGKWSTSAGGQYYAAGVGGALAGRGADLFVIDDPHSEQDVKSNSRLAFDTAWSWFQTGPLQRLMPGGAIIVIMTRWSLLDLTGRLIDYQAKNPEAVPWEIVELPAILNEKDGTGKPSYGPYGKNPSKDGDSIDTWSKEQIFDNMENNNGEYLDKHIGDDVPEEMRDAMVKDVMERLAARGLAAGNVEQTLAKLQKKRKDYLKEIKRAVSNMIFGTVKQKTIIKPNRRQISGLKGTRKVKTAINVILDTSGSMGSTFEKVLSYIYRNDIEVNMIQADTEVKWVDKLMDKKKIERMKISGLGGTALMPAVEYVVENFNQYNTCILTDGYCDNLDLSRLKGKVLIISIGVKVPIAKSNGKVKQICVDINDK